MENRFIKVESTQTLRPTLQQPISVVLVLTAQGPKARGSQWSQQGNRECCDNQHTPGIENRHPAQELQPSYNPQVLGNWEKLSPVSGDGCENSKRA
jgi:hypothetical protein